MIRYARLLPTTAAAGLFVLGAWLTLKAFHVMPLLGMPVPLRFGYHVSYQLVVAGWAGFNSMATVAALVNGFLWAAFGFGVANIAISFLPPTKKDDEDA